VSALVLRPTDYSAEQTGKQPSGLDSAGYQLVWWHWDVLFSFCYLSCCYKAEEI